MSVTEGGKMLELKIVILLLVFTLAGFPIIFRAKYKPWSLDKWDSTSGTILKYDKLEHLILAAILFWFWNVMPIASWCAIVITLWIGFVWEVKDGIKAYNPAGDIEGFSWKDFIANAVGIFLGYYIYRIIFGVIEVWTR